MPSRRTGTRGPVKRNPAAPRAQQQHQQQQQSSVPARHAPAPAPAPAHAAPAPAPASTGSGIGGFVSNMAAATAGSVIGHTIAHGVLGLGHAVAGDKGEAAPATHEAAAAAPAPHEAAAAPAAFPAGTRGAAAKNPCWQYQESLFKCLESNSELSRCNWAQDMLQDCKNQYRIKDV